MARGANANAGLSNAFREVRVWFSRWVVGIVVIVFVCEAEEVQGLPTSPKQSKSGIYDVMNRCD